MNINRRMMVVVVVVAVMVENGATRMGRAVRGMKTAVSKQRGEGDENDAGNPAFAVF